MDNALIEKYKKELLETYKKSRLGASASSSRDFDNKGRLTVNVTAGRGLYPLPNAQVTVFTGPYENMKIIDSSSTDESGKTKLFFLSAPDTELSQSANVAEPVYTDYSLLVRAEGYADLINLNLPVFRGVTSIQNIDMTLSSASDNGRAVINDQRELYNL